MGSNDAFNVSIRDLQDQFQKYDWTLYDYNNHGTLEKMYRWPGNPAEDVMVVVHKSNGVWEPFHRHSFFFINYTYQGFYDSLSQAYDRRITIGQGELYAGQPQAGHALFAHDNHDTIIIGVLIQKEAFFRYFLPLLPTTSQLFHFFLNPKTKNFTDEFIHFKPEDHCELQSILEMMVVEYASGKTDAQAVLRALAVCYLSYIIRAYSGLSMGTQMQGLTDKLTEYLNLHFDTATLGGAGKALGYHPNYLSARIKAESGNTFSGLLLQVRMERALLLLQNTGLSVHDVSVFLGYANTSNFYKAYKGYYGKTPRRE